MSTATSFRRIVDGDRGLVDRKIFFDEAVYQQELEQIYGRCWLFLGHESQISKPNDFVASRMAEDPILLTRDGKGKVHAFLNMCRHRGNRVCRADEGNAPSFMCTYHGWTFATDGKLVGVPGYKEAYFEELDRSQWGLVEVAQLASYKGLVFATWDATAPSLLDYLGDMAWYLDVELDARAGGTEFIGGVQKWVQPCNWKYPCDNNGGDGYHSPITHYSSQRIYAEYEGRYQGGASYKKGNSRTITAGTGHIVAGAGVNLNGAILDRKPTDPLPRNPIERYYVEHMPERVQRLGEFRARNIAASLTFTVFPNFSGGGSTKFRQLHPQGPTHIEEWNWVCADKEAPAEVKNELRRRHILAHSPSGMRGEEDAFNWQACTETARSLIARNFPQNLQLGLGHDERDERFPGFASPGSNEVNQRAFYKRWAEFMDAPSWGQIHIDPRTT